MKKLFILFFTLVVSTIPTLANDNAAEYMNLAFWGKFNDEKLVENLLKAYENNYDLKSAVLKVNEAQRMVKMSFANELPYLGFEGYAGRIFSSSDEVFGKLKIPSYTETHYYLPLAMNYEVDIWGQNRLKTKSKKKQLEMIKQDERSAYIYISSALAVNYFNLIRCDKLVECQKELVALQKRVIDSYKICYELGTATLSDIETAEKALTFMEEDLEKISGKVEFLQNQISALIADKSLSDIERSKYDNLNIGLASPAGIEFDTLAQRPDRIKSELDLERIGIDVKIAKREFLPKFIITGNLGFNMYNLPSSQKFLSNLGVVPVWDIFTGGRKYQMLKIKKNQYDIAVQKYEKAILSSIQETDDALYSLKTAEKVKSITDNRLNHDIKELKYVQIKEDAGVADSLDLLLQKERLIVSQKQSVSSEINRIISAINLYQALGGVDFSNNKCDL